jgi:hypothetical protein
VKPSEALRIIKAAQDAVYEWDGDPDAWPSAAVSAACAAVPELLTAYASVGPASQLPKPNTVREYAGIYTDILTGIAYHAKTDPAEKVRLISALLSVTIDLVGPAVDQFFETSRSNRERAQKRRNQNDTNKQLDAAAEVYRESHLDDSSPIYGRLDSDAAIAKEVGQRLYGDDKATWLWPLRTITDRLRRHRDRWQCGARPADAEIF